MLKNYSFTLSDDSARQIKDHNKRLEKKLDMKVGVSMLINTILSLVYSKDSRGLLVVEGVDLIIREVKKKSIQKKYKIFKI